MQKNKDTFETKRPPTTSNILAELWEKSSSNYSKEELEWFTGADQEAEMLIGELENTLESLGCLVASDGGTGNFQSKCDVSQLLFLTVQSLRTVRGLIHVSDSAKDRLINPELYLRVKGKR